MNEWQTMRHHAVCWACLVGAGDAPGACTQAQGSSRSVCTESSRSSLSRRPSSARWVEPGPASLAAGRRHRRRGRRERELGRPRKASVHLKIFKTQLQLSGVSGLSGNGCGFGCGTGSLPWRFSTSHVRGAQNPLVASSRILRAEKKASHGILLKWSVLGLRASREVELARRHLAVMYFWDPPCCAPLWSVKPWLSIDNLSSKAQSQEANGFSTRN